MERCVAGRSPVLRRQVQQRPSVAADTGRSGVWLRLRQQGETRLSLSLSLSLSSHQNRAKVGFFGGVGHRVPLPYCTVVKVEGEEDVLCCFQS